MEVIIVIAVVVVVGIYANKYMQEREQVRKAEMADANLCNLPKEELESKRNNMENKEMVEQKGTRDLFMETLTKIGCQYEIGEDGDINFGYQGEYFVVRASDENRYIQIYDTHWAQVELYDIDEFARLKKAINESNIVNSVITIYTINKAGGNVDVHCKATILFIPQIPEVENYLRLELNEFFRAHQFVNAEMARLREQEGNT